MFFGNDEMRQDNGYGENIDINIHLASFSIDLGPGVSQNLTFNSVIIFAFVS